jgi:Raf kinase inhibitor-like YbhB/YbcL family protein
VKYGIINLRDDFTMSEAVAMHRFENLNCRSGKAQWWIAALILLGIIVVILVSLPARDTHIPPQPTPPAPNGGTGGEAQQGTSPEDKMGGFTITSSVFKEGERIPPEYTTDGKNISPPLSIAGVPEGTISLALIMDDPDAPAGVWDHWLVWNIPAAAREIAAGSLPAGVIQGANGWGKSEYGGPAPPSGTHRYEFKLYALDAMLSSLKAGSDKKALQTAMEGHILAECDLTGTYSRKK